MGPVCVTAVYGRLRGVLDRTVHEEHNQQGVRATENPFMLKNGR
jgi:hypothetical protein